MILFDKLKNTLKKGEILMGKFIKFERMITPIFIQIVFWIGFFVIILGGLGTAIFGIFTETGKIMMILSGLATMVIGPIVLRVYCEILIVIFKMQGALIDIREELRDTNRSVPPAPTPTPSPSQPAPTPSRQAPSQPTPRQQQSTQSPPSDADDLL